MLIDFKKFRIGDLASVQKPVLNQETFELEYAEIYGAVVMLTETSAVVETGDGAVAASELVPIQIDEDFLLKRGFVKLENESEQLCKYGKTVTQDEECAVYEIRESDTKSIIVSIMEKKAYAFAVCDADSVVMCNAYAHNVQHVLQDYNFNKEIKN